MGDDGAIVDHGYESLSVLVSVVVFDQMASRQLVFEVNWSFLCPGAFFLKHYNILYRLSALDVGLRANFAMWILWKMSHHVLRGVCLLG